MCFPFSKLMWFAAAASLAVALSGCGGGSSIPVTPMMPGDGGTTMMPGDGGTTMMPGDGDTTMMPGDGDTTMMPGDGDTTMMPGDGDTTMMPGDGDTTMMPGDGDTTMMPGDGDTTMMPGDGDTTMMPGDGDTPMTLSVSVFEGAVNADPVIAANVIAAIGKAAQARPLPGSVTQSSNVDSGGITTDTVRIDTLDLVSEYALPRFWVGDGRAILEPEWWIDMDIGEGDPYPIVDLSPPWKGVHLSKYLNSYSHREGGTLYVDVNSDIEALYTQTVDVQIGDKIDLFCQDLLGPSYDCSGIHNISIMNQTQGTLNGVQGAFTCPGGASCRIEINFFFPSPGSGDFVGAGFDVVTSAMGMVFTSEVIDADYISLGTWLFVPDNVAKAADYVFGAFTDGGDHFLQSNIMALQSTASYEGNAIGVYTEMTPEGTNIDDFNGEVRLTANFGGTSDLGTISGSITNFEVDGERGNGMLTLGTAPIGSQNSGFFKGQVSGSDVEHTYVGNWGGQFFGNSESDGKPGSAAGTFGGHSTDDAVNFVGAFGAHKQ